MKGIAFLSGFISVLITSGVILPASSQVNSDNTTNTTVNTSGNNFNILNGIQKGNNLFHSFKEFSIPTGGSATFQTKAAIENIINRVTGGNISNIDGLIKASGNANLFLINPNGIVFGENARLDIGGSFLATTAESLLFEDGFNYSAINSQETPLLTVSVPIGLQYGNNSSPIQLQKSHLSVSPTKTLALLGGDVVINGGSLKASGGKVELGGLSIEGKIDITPTVNFPKQTSKGNISINNAAVVDVSSVNGGSIAINVFNFQMSGESILQAGLIPGITASKPVSGDIVINAVGDITLSEKSLIRNDLQTGTISDGGEINIKTNSLFLTDGSVIQTVTESIGTSGDINIKANSLIRIAGFAEEDLFSSILTSPAIENNGNGGNINFETNNLLLVEGGIVSTDNDGAGSSGNLFIQAKENIDIIGNNPKNIISRLNAEVDSEATGNGGNITIQSNNLNLLDGGRISIDTEGSGNSGNLNIETTNLRLIDGGRISLDTESTGNAGNLNIKTTGNIDIIGTKTDGSVSRIDGDVDKNAIGNGGNIFIQSNNLLLVDGGRISIETEGKGNAGNLNIKNVADIEVIGSSFQGTVSRIVGKADQAPATGNGGNISIETSNLRLIDGGRLSVETEGLGNGGNLEVRARESIEIIGTNPQGTASRIEAQVDDSATGNGGDIFLQTNYLLVSEGGKISVDTESLGKGGLATINATEIELKGVSSDGKSPSRITAISDSKAAAGSLNINTGNLSILDGAKIAVSGLESGDAGNININANSIFLDNQASILAQVKNGNQGNINLKVQDSITANNNSQINANITGNSNGGSIYLTADKLEFTNGSFFSTNTTSNGNAGSINLTGHTLYFDGELSGVFSEATNNSTGNAGNINLNANYFKISNNAKLSTNSIGLGEAGDINIFGGIVKADKGNISATSLQTGGGNLFFDIDRLILQNQSLISTSVLNGTGIGGNITINSPIIIGIENSDIIANAVEGNGGNINITTQGIFGLEFRDQLTEENDITASSEFGVNGTVQINNFGIDPSSGLVELSTELVNSSQQVTSGCSRKTDSTFVATGRGGIPHNPSQYLNLNSTWSDIRDLSTLSKNNNIDIDEISETPNKPAILEATGFVRNSSGEIELVAMKDKSFINNPKADCSGIAGNITVLRQE